MILRSQPSKLLALLPLNIHHIKQWGVEFQISKFRCRPNCPANKPTNLAHATASPIAPEKDRHRVPRFLSHLALQKQMINPLALHIQHQFTNTIFLLLKFLEVKIFLKTAVQIKKVTGRTIVTHGLVIQPIEAQLDGKYTKRKSGIFFFASIFPCPYASPS